MTALHWAAERGHAVVAELLLSADAAVEATTRVGSYTPLHLASRGGHGSIVRALLEAGRGSPCGHRAQRRYASPPRGRCRRWCQGRLSTLETTEPRWTRPRHRRAKPR